MNNKERLEKIQQNDLIQVISDGFLFGKDGLKTENIFRDVEWLIQQAERVEELELEINGWREEVQKWQQFYKESEESHLETKELLHSTISEIKRYKQALEFYADVEHYKEKLISEAQYDADGICISNNEYAPPIIYFDNGEKARKALESEK